MFCFSVFLGIEEEARKDFVSSLGDNPFLNLQREFSTPFKVNTFVKKTKYYIPPQEVKLPVSAEGVVRTFQYIPIIDLVNAIVSDPGFKEADKSPPESGVLYDLKDGASWQKNPYFVRNKEALALELYSDELGRDQTYRSTFYLVSYLRVPCQYEYIVDQHWQKILADPDPF